MSLRRRRGVGKRGKLAIGFASEVEGLSSDNRIMGCPQSWVGFEGMRLFSRAVFFAGALYVSVRGLERRLRPHGDYISCAFGCRIGFKRSVCLKSRFSGVKGKLSRMPHVIDRNMVGKV